MDFDWYQARVARYDLFVKKRPKVGDAAFVSKILGLCGESGEVAEKFKKILRDKQGKLTAADRQEIIKELGDVLWYIATLARYLDTPLSEVAEHNVSKLQTRLEQGKISGDGDNR
jgi:NTP pyrophosphatase (non-canonical NTP hydrolase)